MSSSSFPKMRSGWTRLAVGLLVFLTALRPGAPAFEIRIENLGPGGVAVSWPAQTGTTYELYWRSNLLASTPWLLLGSVAATNTTMSLVDTGAVDRLPPSADPTRFYVVREMQTVSSVLTNDFEGNTVLTLAGSPYYVPRSLRVNPGARLTVQAGVTVLFARTVFLTVEGTLVTQGTPGAPVTFTSAVTAGRPGDWEGLRFVDSSVDADCQLDGLNVQFARIGISCVDASPQIRTGSVRACSSHGIYLERSSPLIQGNTLERNGGSGIFATDASSPAIVGNVLRGNLASGIEFQGVGNVTDRNSKPRINGNSLLGNVSFAVRAQASFRPAELVIDARNNWWGTADPFAIAQLVYDLSDSTTAPVVDIGGWLDDAGGNPVPGRFASGPMTSNLVWRLADSPIHVFGHVAVSSNLTLTIEPGVEARFYGNWRLDVSGALRSLGTPAQRVTLTSGDPAPFPGDWEGVRFLDGSDDGSCVLSNTTVQFAKVGITCVDAAPAIVGARVTECSQHGLSAERSSPLIAEGTFEYNGQDGIYCFDASSPLIRDCQLRGNASDGLEFTGSGTVTDRNSKPRIVGNTFIGNAGFAIRSAAPYRPAELMIDARTNYWGTVDPVAIAQVVFDYVDSPTSAPLLNIGNWLASPGGSAAPGSYAAGPAGSNTVWRLADSPIHVFGSLVVGTNASLTIEAGVTARFYGAFRVDVNGTLRALGTPGQPITLTSGDPAPLPADWEGVRFQDSSRDASCVLSNTTIEFARVGLTLVDASPTLVAIRVRECSSHGATLERSSPLIRGGTFEFNGLDGINLIDDSSPEILDNVIRGNGSDGIDLTGVNAAADRNSKPRINGNTFSGNLSYAIRATAQYRPAELTIDARNNWWGTADPVAIGALVFDYTDSPATAPLVNIGGWLAAPGGPPTPGTYVNGLLTGNVVWRLVDSPIRIFGNVTVATNASLLIEPGVDAQFFGRYRIDVHGTLQSLGTTAKPVRLTSGDPVPLPGDWDGLRFLDASVDASCVLSNTIVEFATTGITCTDASPWFQNCTVWENSGTGISLTRSSPRIDGADVEYNAGDGIYCTDLASPVITRSRIVANGGDGIEVDGPSTAADRNSRPSVTLSEIFDNVAFAIRSNARWRPAEVQIEARTNWWGSSAARTIAAQIQDYTDNPSTAPVVNYGNWLVAPGGAPMPGLFVSGPVYGTNQWRAADSPVGLIGPILVTSNAAVVIAAGVNVQVFGNFRWDVAGILQVHGQTNAPVSIAPDPGFGTPGAWLGLRFLSNIVDAECVLSNAVVSFANNTVECYDASPQFIGCTVERANAYGFYLERSSPLLVNCTIRGSRQAGLQAQEVSSPVIRGGAVLANGGTGLNFADRCAPQITGLLIRSNAGDGIALSGGSTAVDRNSPGVINGSQILDNRGYALRTATFFRPAEVRIDARSNWWGTADAVILSQMIFDYQDSPTQLPIVDYGNWVGVAGGPPQSGTFVTGPLNGTSIWTVATSPVRVYGNTRINSNAVVHIGPGVEVQFPGNYRFDIDGCLTASGTPTNRVVFTSGRALPAKNDWPGLAFAAGSSNQPCVLSNAVVEFADIGVSAAQCSPRLAGVQFRRNRTGLALDTSASIVSDALIELNDTGAAIGQWSRPTITGSTVTLNFYNGIELTSTSTAVDRNPQPVLAGNSLFGNSKAGAGYYSLRVGTMFQPTNYTIAATSNWWGTADTNGIEAAIYDRRDSASSPRVDYTQFLTNNFANFAALGTRSSNYWFSPNADGQQDQSAVFADLSEAASWSLLILDAAGQVRRSIPGAGASAIVDWDGRDDANQPVPEGRYRTVMTGSRGSDGRRAVAYGDAVRIDRTAPVSQPVVTTLPDGLVANDLVVVGTASDLGQLQYYLVEYGPGLSPAAFSRLASNTVPVVNGQLGRMDSRLLSNGVYTLRVQVRDVAGNVTTTFMTFQVDNVLIGDPQVASFRFDPQAGGNSFSFNLSHPADITLRLRAVRVQSDAIGNLSISILAPVLRTFALGAVPGPVTVPWDGRDAAGNPVTNSVYVFSIAATAALGRTNSYDPPYVSGPVSFTNVVVSSNFNFVANEPMTIGYSLQAPAFVGIGIVPFSTFLSGAPREAGPHVEAVDGRDPVTHQLITGQFQVNMKAEVMPENGFVAEHLPPVIITSLQAESYVMSPTMSGVAEIRYSLAQAANVELRLRDPFGNLITLRPRSSQAAGTHAIEWAGTDPSGLVYGDEGDCEILLSAIDPVSGQEVTRSANLSLRR